MNKNEVANILTKVVQRESVNRDTLRNVARSVKVKQGKNKRELEGNLITYAEKLGITRGPGRPVARREDVIGYKVKIGLRYPKANGILTTNMRDGETYPDKAACQVVVDQLVAEGKIRLWGGSVRAKFLPRYDSKQ